MKKNVAGQSIGAQMVSATTGAAFTSAVTVAVTGDAGTQATGSVGSGACTHEGNGYHTYAPAQAETNYDLIAFTFTGTGAIPVTVQVYPSFPQTGDNFARLGAPAGASVSADVAAVKVDTAAVKVQTDKLVFTVANQVDSNTKSNAGTAITAAAGIQEVKVASVATNALTAAALAADAGAEIADAVLDRDMSIGTDSGSTTVRTARQALRAIRNKVDISAGTLTVKKEDDSTTSWTAAVTTNAAADPITAIDPAGP